MKRFFIILSFVALVSVGVFYLSNNNSKPKTPVVNRHEISLKQISSNVAGGSLLIDVRTAKEYKADHAEGSVNLPLESIEKGKVPTVAKDKIIYVYCHSGKRASQAKAILEQTGYNNVINITSLYNWVAMGGKVTGTNPTCSVDDVASC